MCPKKKKKKNKSYKTNERRRRKKEDIQQKINEWIVYIYIWIWIHCTQTNDINIFPHKKHFKHFSAFFRPFINKEKNITCLRIKFDIISIMMIHECCPIKLNGIIIAYLDVWMHIVDFYNTWLLKPLTVVP